MKCAGLKKAVSWKHPRNQRDGKIKWATQTSPKSIGTPSRLSRAEAYDSFCLFSCFCNGQPEPASAIVSIQPPGVDGEDEYVVHPLFMSVTL